MRKAFFLLIITILLLITAVLIFAAVTTKRENLPGAVPSPSIEPYALLSFSPEILNITDSSASATQTVDIVLDTNGKGAFGAQIELQYDPQVITNVKLTTPNNPFFGTSSAELINIISQEEGRATYAIGISPNENEKKGVGAIATLSFTVDTSRNRSTEITILPISSIYNLKDDGSVLEHSSAFSININTQ